MWTRFRDIWAALDADGFRGIFIIGALAELCCLAALLLLAFQGGGR